MSRVERVERVENQGQKREADRRGERRGDAPNVGHTPGKAEGEERDVDEALDFDSHRSHQR